MTNFTSELQAASKEAAAQITISLHAYLANAGWPSTAAKSVRITKTGKGFGIAFEGPASKEAEALEYGSEAIRPSAAVRKFLGQSAALEGILMQQIEKKLGRIL